jgi:hypothetical protein
MNKKVSASFRSQLSLNERKREENCGTKRTEERGRITEGKQRRMRNPGRDLQVKLNLTEN